MRKSFFDCCKNKDKAEILCNRETESNNCNDYSQRAEGIGYLKNTFVYHAILFQDTDCHKYFKKVKLK